jgi:DNA mismatch repair protein MutS2
LEEHRKKEEERLQRFDDLYEHQQKILRYGRQFNELMQHYFQTGQKKVFLSSLMKWVEQEKLKKEKNRQPDKVKKTSPSKTGKNHQKTEKEIKKRLQNRSKTKKKQPQKPKAVPLHPGDTVRVKDSFMTGIITKLEKDEAFVQAGQVTLRIPKKKLELVKKA